MEQCSPTELTNQFGVNSTKNKMWLEFIVLGVPVPENSKTKYTTKKVVEHRRRVAEAAAEFMYGEPCLTGPIHVHHGFHMPIPKGWSKAKRAAAVAGEILPDVIPDYENLIKPVNDACKGIVWDDDARITDGSQRKRYSEMPMTIVLIKRMGCGS